MSLFQTLITNKAKSMSKRLFVLFFHIHKWPESSNGNVNNKSWENDNSWKEDACTTNSHNDQAVQHITMEASERAIGQDITQGWKAIHAWRNGHESQDSFTEPRIKRLRTRLVGRAVKFVTNIYNKLYGFAITQGMCFIKHTTKFKFQLLSST